MKISFSPNLNHVQLSQSKKINQNTVAQTQTEQSENINYPKISPAQYMSMRGVSFGALFRLSKDDEAQLIKDIENLDTNDKKTLRSILKRINNPKNDINLQDVWGETALTRASKWGHAKIVEKLLTRPDIDVNLQDIFGCTALMYASSSGRTEVVEKLLAHPDIDINKQNEAGRTALMMTACNGHKEVVEKLLAKDGIDINQQDSDGYTALMNASDYGRPRFVEKLLARPDIDVNLQNKNGCTALMYASLSGYEEIVEKLLAKDGIDINQQDSDGYTALMRASENGHTEVVEKLLTHPDIDVNLRNEDIKTALDIAKEKGHTQILKMFEIFEANKVKANVENDLKLENERFLADVRKIRDKECYLTIEQIEKFLQYPNLKDIINENLSNVDEDDIGKMLLYLGDSSVRVAKIVKKIQQAGYDFNKKYSDGRTLMDMAKEWNKDFASLLSILLA